MLKFTERGYQGSKGSPGWGEVAVMAAAAAATPAEQHTLSHRGPLAFAVLHVRTFPSL